MKGQPLAYNKDNQEDKEGLFDSADTIRDTLTIFVDMVGGIRVKADAMRAAALQALPRPPIWPTTWSRKAPLFAMHTRRWRTPYAPVKKKAAIWRSCPLPNCRSSILPSKQTIHQVLTLEGSVAARRHIGGTAPERVRIEAERVLAQTAG